MGAGTAVAGSCHNGTEGTVIFSLLGKDVGPVKDIGGGVTWGLPKNRVKFWEKLLKNAVSNSVINHNLRQ